MTAITFPRMQSPRQRRLRCGEPTLDHERRNRFFQREHRWYFATREGRDMGPFGTRDEALLSLLYYLERCGWGHAGLLQRYREQRCF